MNRLVLKLTIAAALFGASRIAAADIVTIEFSGHVSGIVASYADGSNASADYQAILPFQAGDTFIGQFKYDTSAVDTNSHSQFGQYEALLHEVVISGSIVPGQYVFGNNAPRVTVYNDTSSL